MAEPKTTGFFFSSLKDCLIFFNWLHEKRGKQKRNDVVRKIYERLRQCYKTPDESKMESSLSTFLASVDTFYKKLIPDEYSDTLFVGANSMPRDPNVDQVVDALLECLPKFLAAMYYLWYNVDAAFNKLGGGEWQDNHPGVDGYRWAWLRYGDWGGATQRYLRATTHDKEFGNNKGVIPGGFLTGDLKEGWNYNSNKGYYYAKYMIPDIEAILRKNEHNYFRDVFVTSVIADKLGAETVNVANALALVSRFCEIVGEEAKHNGGTLKGKLEEDIKKEHKCSIKWEELKDHCRKLQSELGKIFKEGGFSFTGYGRESGDLKTVEFAQKTAEWLRNNLLGVKDKMTRIGKVGSGLSASQNKNLAEYLTKNFFPYGFTFYSSRYYNNNVPYEVLKTDWDSVITMLSKDGDDGGLQKLKTILEGVTCPPKKPEIPPAKAPEVPKQQSTEKKPSPPTKTEATKPDPPKPTSTTTSTTPKGGNTNGGANQGTAGNGPQNTRSRNNASPNQNNDRSGGNAPGSSVATSPSPTPGSAGASGPAGTKGANGNKGSSGSKQKDQVQAGKNPAPQKTPSPSTPHTQPTTPPPATPPGAPAGPASISQPGGGGKSPNGGGGAGPKAGVSSQPGQSQSPSVKSPSSSSPAAPAPGGLPSTGGDKGLPGADSKDGKGQDPKGGVTTVKQSTGSSSTKQSPGPPSSVAPAPGNGPSTGDQVSTSSTTQPSGPGASQNSTVAVTTASSSTGAGAGGGAGGAGVSGGKGVGQDSSNSPPKVTCNAGYTVGTDLAGNDVCFRNYKKPTPNRSYDDIWQPPLKRERDVQVQSNLQLNRGTTPSTRTQINANSIHPPGLFAPVPSTQPTGVPPGRGRDYYEVVDGSRRTQLPPDNSYIFADGEVIEDPSFQARQEKVDRRTEAEQKRNALRWQVDQQALSNLLQIEQTKSDAYEKDAKTKWDEMQRIHFLNSVQHETSLGGNPVDEVDKDPGRHDRLMERLYQENEDTIIRDYMSDQERLKNRQKQDANQNMDAVRRWEEEQKKTFLTYFQNQNQNLATASVSGHPIKPELPHPRNGPQVLMYPEVALQVVADKAKQDFAKSGSVTQNIKQYYEQKMQRDDFENKQIQLQLDKEIKEASDAQQKGVKQAEDIAKKEYLHNRFHGGYIDILPRNNRLDDNDHPPTSHLDLQISTRSLPPPLDLSDPVDTDDERNINDIDDVIPTEATHKTVDFTFDDPFSVPAPKVVGISRVPPNPNDFKTRKLNVPLFSDPTKCQNPWYVTPLSTDTVQPPTSPVPASDQLPLPRTVREMLYWFVGLNQYGLIGMIKDYVVSILVECNKDASELSDALEVIREPYTLDASHVAAKLTEVSLYSATVVYKVRHNNDFEAFSTFDFESEYGKFRYSPDPAGLLCQLRDYVYVCCHQLQFLKAQCKRGKSHGGWKDCHYGSDTKTPSPLQAFLTDSCDSTFEAHPFDPCNLCLKSRVRMGFRMEDLPKTSQLGSVISTILTPSCGGEDPLLTLSSYLNCLTRRTPRTTGELVSFFHHFGNELHGYVSGLSSLGDSLTTSHPDCPDWDHLDGSDLDTVRGIRGSESLNVISKHNSSHDKEHPRTLSTLVGCSEDNTNCHPHCSPITYRAYALYSQSFAHTYLSWVVYLPDRLHDSLEKLRYDLQKHLGSGKCSSLHQCDKGMPLLYLHGFTPPEGTSQVSVKCSDVIEKIKDIVAGQPIASLMAAMDNFLYGIREPFIYTVVALWSVAFLIFANTMLYRLDVLYIRSHLLRTKASHLIDVKALLSDNKKMMSLYDANYFDDDPNELLNLR